MFSLISDASKQVAGHTGLLTVVSAGLARVSSIASARLVKVSVELTGSGVVSIGSVRESTRLVAGVSIGLDGVSPVGMATLVDVL